ncbi:MAG: hypothetical protein U1E53_02880 [Dongiaceae bacterium]
MRGLVLAWVVAGLLGLLVAASGGPGRPAAAGASAGPPAELLEPEQQVTVLLQAGANAQATRSFRLGPPKDGAPAKLTFLLGDLRDAEGRVVDRANLKVTGPDSPGPEPRDYLLTVTGVGDPGVYQGKILIIDAGAPERRLEIPVTVNAVRRGVSWASDSTAVALKRAASCDALTRWALGAGACPASYVLFLDGDPQAIAKAEPSLRLTFPDGSRPPIAADPGGVPLGLRRDGTTLRLTMAEGGWQAGHYAGTLSLDFGGLADRLTAPVTIDVRMGALWALLAIAAGVLVGKISSYMQGPGKALADAWGRLDRARQRLSNLTDARVRNAFAGPLSQIEDNLRVGEVTAAASALGVAETILGHAQALDLLQRRGALPPAASAMVDQLAAAVAANDQAAVEDRLKAIKAEIDKQAAAGAGARGLGGGGAGAPAAGWRAWLAAAAGWAGRVRFVFVTRLANPLLRWVLLVTLILAGLDTLYVKGASTLGASPFADLLALFAWGLTADVASRTLANFRGTA